MASTDFEFVVILREKGHKRVAIVSSPEARDAILVSMLRSAADTVEKRNGN